jgi:hypothetical protein
LRRGYADDALGSGGHPCRQVAVRTRARLNDENSASDDSPRTFTFRKIRVPEDTTGRFKPWEDRSMMPGREDGTIISGDVKPEIVERSLKLDREDGATLTRT